MSTESKQLTCSDCGQTFTFTQQEQEFFLEKGYGDPKRCKNCRQQRKAERAGSLRNGYR